MRLDWATLTRRAVTRRAATRRAAIVLAMLLGAALSDSLGGATARAQGFAAVASGARGPGPSGLLPAPSGSPTGYHTIFSADSPPGVVGAARLQRGGAVGGYYQPVAFRGPENTAFSLATEGVFGPPHDSQNPLQVGLLIGAVYRFKVTSIPGYEGEELFPSVEVIDRTYPPHHLAAKYPIPINLELDDLTAALAGQLVTRVIYLEDPSTALAVSTTPESSRALDVPAHQDPLQVADTLGRPVAIVRIGSLSPPTHPALWPQFFFGHPSWVAVQAPADPAADAVADPATAHVGDTSW